jgi:triosephosphate isomerase (TIM)
MEKRIPLIAANWKMHKTVGESVSFTEGLQREVGSISDREVVIAPPFTALAAVRRALTVPGYRLAAQNCHQEVKGAFTGEISGGMLKDIGCEYAIVGHSERRHIFGETDETIHGKVAAVFASGLIPILCVGEVLAEREANRTFPGGWRAGAIGHHGADAAAGQRTRDRLRTGLGHRYGQDREPCPGAGSACLHPGAVRGAV